MTLVAITSESHGVDISLEYATPNNVTGRPIYAQAHCYLHREAAEALRRAVELAADLELRLIIYDAFRPTEAQWCLWNFNPDPDFVADPRRGSPHSRGAAVDVGLVDRDGRRLDMGTAFDDFTEFSYHACRQIPVEAQKNRIVLLGLMTAAGWDFYRREWWHYQLFDARRYPLYSDSALALPMMRKAVAA